MWSSLNDSNEVYLSRVVAVIGGNSKRDLTISSGYLVAPHLVLTAKHAVTDKLQCKAFKYITVQSAGTDDAADVSIDAITYCDDLDFAIIRLPITASWAEVEGNTSFARMRRDRTGVINDCSAVGFPLYQRNAAESIRDVGEIHGVIYQLDGVASGYLLLREPIVRPFGDSFEYARTSLPSTSKNKRNASPWSGFSGAAVFAQGRIIGVIAEHHGSQGQSAVRIVGIDQLLRSREPKTRAVIDSLGVAEPAWLTSDEIPEIIDLVDLIGNCAIVQVNEINAYDVGATRSHYSDGVLPKADPYIERTSNEVDSRLRGAVLGEQLIVLIGPSKAGKTRTAFEALARTLPTARMIAPNAHTVQQLAHHPDLQATTDHVIIWLDELNRFLVASSPLTPEVLARIRMRPGPTTIISTLRTEQRAQLLQQNDEVTRNSKRLLDSAVVVELRPTSEDPDEQSSAARRYPKEDLRFGLGAQLAGAPSLAEHYASSRDHSPVNRAVLQAAIDWQRTGREDAIPEPRLRSIAAAVLAETSPWSDETKIPDAIAEERTPLEGGGLVAALITSRTPDGGRAYRAFDYLVAIDDGQHGPQRDIPDHVWSAALTEATAAQSHTMALQAYNRGYLSAAKRAAMAAADHDHPEAMFLLGYLAAERDEPKDISAGVYWYERAAQVGSAGAMTNLGLLYIENESLGKSDEARVWLEKAVDAGGSPKALVPLARLIEKDQDPDLSRAEALYARAATAGDTRAKRHLARLFASSSKLSRLTDAEKLYIELAARGEASAMRHLGALLCRSEWKRPRFREGCQWYEKAFKAGDLESAHQLGHTYLTAFNPPRTDDARRWLLTAVEGGDSSAMQDLAWMYAMKQNPPDLGESLQWARKSVEAGSVYSHGLIGQVLADLSDPPDLTAAEDSFTKGAMLGDVYSMRRLGEIYSADYIETPPQRGHTWHHCIIHGTWTEIDQSPRPQPLKSHVRAAIKWYEQAAEKGDSDSMRRLATLYKEWATPVRLRESVYWYQMAADQGDADAMSHLGHFYAYEKDPQDLEKGIDWYIRAGDNNVVNAYSNVGYIFQYFYGDLDAATSWYKRDAEAGSVYAMNWMGRFLLFDGDPANLRAAQSWFERAAKADDTEGMLGVADILLNRLMPAQPKAAARWYEKAAKADSVEAMFALGHIYANNMRPRNVRSAILWYRKGANEGDLNSVIALADALVNDVTPPDLQEAYELYKQASDCGSQEAKEKMRLIKRRIRGET
ncbi:bifunctional trypsin-like peptidase domain-containing/SEL1-like repeat protein [Mycobacterium sp. 236(2023)]|uniref:bifunctional trypsin-like peptidase domain-containing/SEL1-like repeat protein n=1 Tax=Mycobacterium sp. 236(2023) TaxID=3038163 RepID=UPI00241534B8|nr:bifunctional trypsin-like peptidase domain-containing/SEL1-like repeat protein [Mycobacterium sp. 236(2023)]MDG4667951.1 bifunctional trypsin-like peptidase domain-containing/SEL1-like repeat protein [Mycobacterium sp. 236(2023)]